MSKILVVDDDPMNLKMAGFILKKDNHEVVDADSGEKCISLLKEQSFDLVLLDIEMPGMSGIDALRQIRSMGFSVPVIFLSASDASEVEAEMQELQVVNHVKKPFMPNLLLEAVANA